MYYLNNNYISANQTNTINIADRGFLLGDGVFTTLRVSRGTPMFIDKHVARINQHAAKIFINIELDLENIRNICKELLISNNLDKSEALIRITVTRGTGARGIDISEQKLTPTLLICAMPYHDTIDTPLRLCSTSVIRNERSILSQIKSLNYLESILARSEARAKGFNDGIMFNTRGMITECSVANIFFLTCNNEIVTPPVADGALPGIFRDAVISACNQLNIINQETSVAPSDISGFSSGFVTNCAIGIKAIGCIDNIQFQSTNAYKIIDQIKQQLLELG